MMTTVRLGTFTRSVVLDVARATGALSAARITVVETAVISSPGQFAGLRDGKLDLVVTSPDNVVAYQYLPANPLGATIDVRIPAAVDRGLGLALCLRPGIDDIADVRSLGVDVPDSGFAFLAYDLLRRAGRARDDLDIQVLGATPRRRDVLLAGECDATILGAGNELTAIAGGASVAGAAVDGGPYLGAVLARRAAGDPEPVDRVAGILVDTAAAIASGALTAEAEAGAERVLSLPPELARRHVQVLRDARSGLVPDGRVDAPSLSRVVALRAASRPDPALASVPERLEPILVGRAR
jgi:hypothetical protein